MAELEYLTPEEVADKLRIHERTVRRLLADGKLPGERIGGKKWRISAAALSAYLGDRPAAVAAPSVKQAGDDPFDGDLDAARRRLRDLADSACEVLDARLLNILSFHLAMYIDKDAGGRRAAAVCKREGEEAAEAEGEMMPWSPRPAGRRKSSKPAACYQTSRTGFNACQTCGELPSVIHIPICIVGYFCEKCCPACRERPAAKR
jgi:excisionase family DNA binding protein